MSWFLVVLLLTGAALRPQAQSRPATGMVITRSVTLAAGEYVLKSAAFSTPAIVIRGSNVTVDFKNVVLRGAPQEADPDAFTGVAVLVDGGENVTIKNLHAHGYKIGILARGSRKLHITGGDFSYNWKPRLYSLVEHESLVDWMSYHHNDKDEWLESGAGIYLADSDDAEIDNTTIVQGQNGLMLARSNRAKIWNNDLSLTPALASASIAPATTSSSTTRWTGACAATATRSTTAGRTRPAS